MTPKKRFPYYDSDLRLNAEALLWRAGLNYELSVFENWKIYCVDQVQGMFHESKGYITIPLFVIQRPKGEGYLKWYVSHELAHLFNYHYATGKNHDAGFMTWLKKICPREFLHFETGYKPSLAAAAGITSKRQDALLQSFKK
jgi:hypothetical protein